MKTAYIFNLDSKLIDKGSLTEVAKNASISYKNAYYAITRGGIIRHRNFYLSWDKNATVPELTIRNKTLTTRSLSVKNTKHLLKSNKIIELRKEKNISREKLAILLNVSVTVIWSMECIPTHNPTISVMMKLAKYYNVKIDKLVDMDVFKLAQLTTIE